MGYLNKNICFINRKAPIIDQKRPPKQCSGGRLNNVFLTISVEGVDDEARPEFGLEPSGFRGHDVACVGNIHKLFHADGIEREGHGHLARIDATLEFAESPDAADKVDALVRTQVGDAENVAEYAVSEYHRPPR